jgi:hypothetical protein
MASPENVNTESEQPIEQDENAVDTSSTLISKAALPRRHRRNRPAVRREDIIKFRAEVLGIPPDSSADKQFEEPDEGREDLKELELAFSHASMSLAGGNSNSINANTNPNAGAGLFTNFFENNPSPTSGMASLPRPSPPSPAAGQNGGGMTGMNVAMPMNAGYQMDLNQLYEMVLELSEVLKNNRDMTKGIINSAEEIMVCSFFSAKVSSRVSVLPPCFLYLQVLLGTYRQLGSYLISFY